MSKKKEIYYQAEDYNPEGLERSLEDSVEMYLDSLASSPVGKETTILPKKITVKEFELKEVEVKHYADGVINGLLESLDDDYGNPEADYTEPTDEMREIALNFVNEILKQYDVWACEENGKKHQVDVVEWVNENCPHWITEGGVTFEEEK